MDKMCEDTLLRIEGKIDNLPCADRGERLARLEQKNENGQRQEDVGHNQRIRSFGLWRILVAIGGLTIVVLQVMGMIK